MTKSEREAYWGALQQRQADSGLSARAWCSRELVGYAAFVYWRRRLERARAIEPLTLIRVREREAVGDGLWLWVGEVRIEVRPGFDAGLLKQVVATLAA